MSTEQRSRSQPITANASNAAVTRPRWKHAVQRRATGPVQLDGAEPEPPLPRRAGEPVGEQRLVGGERHQDEEPDGRRSVVGADGDDDDGEHQLEQRVDARAPRRMPALAAIAVRRTGVGGGPYTAAPGGHATRPRLRARRLVRPRARLARRPDAGRWRR